MYRPSAHSLPVNSTDTAAVTRRIAEEKTALRRTMRTRARALAPDYRAAADAQICRLLLSLPEYRNASRIFCFVSRPEEADTLQILRHALSAGKTVAVPRCEAGGIMHAHSIRNVDADLAPGMCGISEPSADRPRMAPEAFDLILVPCCTCSHTGVRLGFGGGYYDRFLEHTSACTILLCREALVSERIPSEPHDRRIDIVLTEAGVFR